MELPNIKHVDIFNCSTGAIFLRYTLLQSQFFMKSADQYQSKQSENRKTMAFQVNINLVYKYNIIQPLFK